jgi:hypothetical protein
MNRPPVPGSVTLGRVLLIVEGVLWLLLGALVILGGVALLALPNGQFANQILSNINNANVTLTTIGVTLLVFGAILAVLAIVGIWSGAALGRLTSGPRVAGIVLAALGVIIGLLDAVDAGSRVHTARSAIYGIVLIVLNLLILYAIAIAPSARAAFRAAAEGRRYATPQGFGTPTSGAGVPPSGTYLNPYGQAQQPMYTPPPPYPGQPAQPQTPGYGPPPDPPPPPPPPPAS